jgi:hypothetical protein
MKTGDKVRPIGFPLDSRPGTVKMASGNKVAVTWIMGSGWKWDAIHDINELEVAL